MRRFATAVLIAVTLTVLCAPVPATAQTPAPLEVGAVAPDFTLPGATRHGVLAEPVSLGDYEGETVVLAFFFRARTKG
ncbi:MAG: redoxin domain-containing protein [Gemmatimonadetes bacterium]|nr:redoxin domain-containing protein [Gemmatimonadota bacterium]NIQ55147.1 redoxin domain-containing protein [Gemmatimonadota bacterium]NIU75349.1 redoxin domain-containing protein [Gammaproteobacteria bacterium]NIX45121.1 redoxin domain-containing protein [Gemmatimonadota bacterium]NIY09372.1 redoxin domain-containing protein [Gemmatimonadota bacterium]